MWEALRVVSLATTKQKKARIESLDDEVLEHGQNFSAGESKLLLSSFNVAQPTHPNVTKGQLLIVARSLLRLHQSSFVFLDEASASLDAETDKIIQRAIRTEMKDAT